MASFIKKDIEILKKRHQVKVVRYSNISDAYTIWKGVRWCDLTFCWFGSIHAFFPILFSKVLAKKSIVVAGGYDVACLPEINYGLFCYWWKKWLPLFVFRWVDIILTVSKSNTAETLKNAKVNAAKVRLVYHGFDSDKSKSLFPPEERPLVLTVGNVSKSTLAKKGLELFVKTSRLLPEVEFILVGRWMDDSIGYLRTIASSNMKFIGEVDQDQLFGIMSKAKVYAQVSRHESFGCALAEAMLCECIPVVSNATALPEVVGDCGFFLTEQSPEKLAALISKALNSDSQLGKRARERIKMHFPLEKREKALLQVVEQLIA
ncbi:MAG: glycosyltransferase family 4 protein [candidate division Zixibacteria bacterium]|nr:glycosyltransferase family 4 protein [candidate division Zixibacteria bacterium]